MVGLRRLNLPLRLPRRAGVAQRKLKKRNPCVVVGLRRLKLPLRLPRLVVVVRRKPKPLRFVRLVATAKSRRPRLAGNPLPKI